jgi:hypothetical protein
MLSPGPATDVSDVERLYSLGWSTDHVALRCVLTLSEPSKKQRSYRRCRSEIDEKAWAQFWSAANLKGIHDSARTLMMGVEKCSKAVHNVTKHVPIELRNSFVALSSSDNQESQFAQAKFCHKLKIKWIDEVRTERFVKSALAAPRQDKSTQQNIQQLKIDGVETEDRTTWAKGISDFYENIYGNDQNGRDIQSERISQLEARCVGSDYICIPDWVMEQCRAAAHGNRHTSPGADGITWDHILFLPSKALAHFRTLFERRLNNVDYEHIEDWCSVMVTLIPKVKRVTTLDELRPISLSSQLMNLHSDPVSKHRVGFIRGRRTMEITGSIRQLL